METSTKLGRVSLAPKGEYDPSASYERLDIVSFDGSGYLVLRPVQGVTPEDGQDYMLLAARGTDGTDGAPGRDGTDGTDGAPGSSIASIERTDGNGAPGTTDTYTVTLTDGTTSTFQVYNGKDGQGAGDMEASVYDPDGRRTDIFKYVDEHVPDSAKDAVIVPGGGTVVVVGSEELEGPWTFEMSEDPEDELKVGIEQVDGLEEALADKQPKLTGQPGQAVGFGEDGSAVAVPGWSNPNLLDNWYLADPINQRGRMEYSGIGYTIDRWVLQEDTGKLVLNSNGVTLSGSAENNHYLLQKMESDLFDKVITYSILLSDGKLYSKTGALSRTIGDDVYIDFDIGQIGFYVYPGYLFGVFIASHQGQSITPVAAKLELGSQQTLAHQDADGNWVLNDPPPNKALELAKCQRYFERSAWSTTLAVAINNSELRFCGSYYFKAVKRVAPAITVGAAHEGQQIQLFDTVDYVYITGLQAIEPIAYNQYMLSPRVSDPQSRLVPGRVYQVIIPDNLYNISADL